MKTSRRFRACLVSVTALLTVALPVLAAEHGEGGGAPHPNWMYLGFHVINLSLLLFIIYRGARRQVKATLVERHDAILEAMEQAERAKREAEELKQKYEQRLSELDSEIAAFHAEVEQKGKEEAERVKADASAAAERIQKDVERRLGDELERARYQLRAETVELAFALAERLLRERVDASDQKRLAEQYLRQIVQSTEIH